MRRKTINILIVFLVVSILLVYLFPVYWMIITGFKTEKEFLSWPPILFPKKITLENYEAIFFSKSLGFFLRNSFLIVTFSTIISLFVGSLAAYGLARLRFGMKLKRNLSFWILSLRMMPPIVFLIPIFIIFAKIRLNDTLLGMILVYTFLNISFVVWLMRGFFGDLPIEIGEAAEIDGCSKWGVFFRVALPLTMPGIVATALFCVIYSWNEFLFAVQLTSFNAPTVTTLISTFITDRGLYWGQMCAAGTVAALPMIIISMFLQRFLVKGLTLGAVK
jgi:multiple sugar transport system permease protein